MSALNPLLAELAALQKTLDPIDSAIQAASPGTDEYRRLQAEHERHWPRARALVSAASRFKPRSPREALGLALILLDYAMMDGGEAGGCDGTGNHLAATKQLVGFLADLAGTAPGEMGLFQERLRETGLAEDHSEPHSAILSACRELDGLWRQHEAVDEDALRAPLADDERAQRILDRISEAEHRILAARPETFREALAVAVMLGEFADATSEADRRARDEAQGRLFEFLEMHAGETVRAIGSRRRFQPATNRRRNPPAKISNL